jgi:Na+-transporting methylmalonyl-CoA/oxaloacetate decarboxylase gamma subunit
MMKKTKYSLLLGIFLFLFLITGKGWAQNVGDLAFNEILVHNDSLNVDGFGQRSSWIEIFNKGYNTVDIGGCYLTNDLNNPTKYWIPTGDPATRIPTRCFILFWADNKPSRGIFHLNFELMESDVIALFDASGKTLIDKLEINQPQYSNVSFGIKEISDEIGNVTTVWDYLDKITPASNNDHTRKVSSGEQFVEYDPTGLGMTVIAMGVVFSSLALLYLIFKTTGTYFVRRLNKSVKVKITEGTEIVREEDLSGEVSAAIAMALHLYNSEIHDEENTVLTIKKVARAYSPWSSKIYTLRKYPN